MCDMKRLPYLSFALLLATANMAQAQNTKQNQFQPFKPIQPLNTLKPIQPLNTFKPIQPVNTLKPIQPATSQSWRSGSTATTTNTNNAPKNNLGTLNGNPYDPNSLSNPYGAGSVYKADGLKNPHSQYGSSYSNKSATNPFATQPPKLVDENGKYLGELSSNPFRPDSVSNPHGIYGNPNSPQSIKNPIGAGNPLSKKKIFVVPGTTKDKSK